MQQNCGAEHPPSDELPLEDPPLDELLLENPPLDELLLENPFPEELPPCLPLLEDPPLEELPELLPAGEPEELPLEKLLVEASLFSWSEDASPPDAMTLPPQATTNAPPASTISRSRRSQCAMAFAFSRVGAVRFSGVSGLHACRKCAMPG